MARPATTFGILAEFDAPERLIDAVYDSAAQLAVIPMQDLLGLGSEARMNVPGKPSGNWGWRFDWSQVDAGSSARSRARAERSGRLVPRALSG